MLRVNVYNVCQEEVKHHEKKGDTAPVIVYPVPPRAKAARAQAAKLTQVQFQVHQFQISLFKQKYMKQLTLWILKV